MEKTKLTIYIIEYNIYKIFFKVTNNFQFALKSCRAFCKMVFDILASILIEDREMKKIYFLSAGVRFYNKVSRY